MPPGCNRATAPVSKSRGVGKVPTLVFHKTILLDWIDFWPVPLPLPKPLHTSTDLQHPNFSFWAVKPVPSLQVPTLLFLVSFQPLNTNEMSFETSFITVLSSLHILLHCMWKLITIHLPIPTPFSKDWIKTDRRERRWTEVLLLPPTQKLSLTSGFDLDGTSSGKKTISVLTLSGPLIILSASSQLWNGLIALITYRF